MESRDPQSILGRLAQRAEQIRATRFYDLTVPGWSDPEIVLRCRPVHSTYIEKAMQRVDRSAHRDTARVRVDEHAGILVEGCVGVVAKLDGREFSLRPGDPEGKPTGFDDDLAQNLGLDTDQCSARDIVRALFFAEGDIVSTATALAGWSGIREVAGEETLAGE